MGALRVPDYDEFLLQQLYDTVTVDVDIVSWCHNCGVVTFDHTIFHDIDENPILFSQVFDSVIEIIKAAFEGRPVITQQNDSTNGRILDALFFSRDNDRAYNRDILDELSNVLHLLKGRNKRIRTFIRFLIECIPHIRSRSVDLGLV